MVDLQDKKSLSHYWWGLTFVAALAGVVLSMITAYRSEVGFFDEGWKRALNTFAFFTVQSNTMVGLTALWLYLRRDHSSTLFRAIWLVGLVAISITGVIYHWLLAGSDDLYGLALVANLIVHTLVPIMAVLGFFVFGPRGLITPVIVRLTLVYLALWGAFTLIRGALIDWYPYPFIDVLDKGYARVLVNGLGIALLYFAVGYGYMLIDRLMNDENPAE